jgi:arsenate reductase
MPGLTVYAYAKCQTCQKAIKWLEARRIPHSVVPIREQPPKQAELKAMLKHVEGDVGRLFNRSVTDYRTLGLSATLKDMPEADAIKLLAGNGNLVKRPFVLTTRVGLVGFDAAQWAKALG